MIALINMPFASLFQPSLALSHFKAQLREAGIAAKVYNFNFTLANRLGFERYEPLQKLGNVDMRIGEWLFTRSAWGDAFESPAERIVALCRNEAGSFGRQDLDPAWLEAVRAEMIPAFLDDCCEMLFSGDDPAIAAFSCVFFQTVPAIALARRIRQRRPDVRTLFGGASFYGEMGAELLAKTPWIDAVATGEADQLFIPAVRAFMQGKIPTDLPGLSVRDAQGAVLPGQEPIRTSSEQLEALPDPDFSDYLAQMDDYARQTPAFPRAPVFLPFEGSRGCWWGEKKPCRFCGLNATGMPSRAKSPARVVRQLAAMARRYPVRRFFAADNNLPMPFLRDFLPALARDPHLRDVQFFCEIKTNLRREWVKALAAAGFKHVQPGIETLSTPLLKALRKGATALQNIYFLKLCRTYRIFPMWNFLIRIPGEQPEDYETMIALLPKIVHFAPPAAGVRPVQAHRFSVYGAPEAGYLDDLRPQAWYDGLFPADRFDLNRVAYYFSGTWRDTIGQDLESYTPLVESVRHWLGVWQSETALPDLCYDPMAPTSGLTLVDTRFGRNGQWRLDPREAAVYRSIDDPRMPEGILSRADLKDVPASAVEQILADFVTSGLAIREGNRFLGLAVPSTATIASAERKILFKRYLD